MLPLAFLTLGCEKDVSKRYKELKAAIRNDDVARVKDIVNRLVSDLPAGTATATDPDGHYNSYLILIERLNEECDVIATGTCYASIDASPETSEIKLEIFSGSYLVTRIITLRPGNEGGFVCINMHE